MFRAVTICCLMHPTSTSRISKSQKLVGIKLCSILDDVIAIFAQVGLENGVKSMRTSASMPVFVCIRHSVLTRLDPTAVTALDLVMEVSKFMIYPGLPFSLCTK